MKYALINGEKAEAQPGLRGACVYCQSDMIGKCGNERVKHWAHKSKASCDPWWENETEWHRAWKNRFPVEWQEIIHKDPTTEEKHIADIKTDKGFVIEFQRSSIPLAEIKKREDFYKNMVWVIDGTHLKRDYPRFCKGFELSLPSIIKEFSFFPEDSFPARWRASSVPVYFDFQGVNPVDQLDGMRTPVWCLYPCRDNGYAVVTRVSRELFKELSSTAPHLLLAQDNLSRITQHIQEQRESQELERKRRAEAFRQFWANPRRGRYKL